MNIYEDLIVNVVPGAREGQGRVEWRRILSLDPPEVEADPVLAWEMQDSSLQVLHLALGKYLDRLS